MSFSQDELAAIDAYERNRYIVTKPTAAPVLVALSSHKIRRYEFQELPRNNTLEVA